MGIMFNQDGTLTESQQIKAKELGLTYDEMYVRLKKLQHQETEVSVIIPVYNGEKYIRQCIESVIKQEYQEKEIIVVDDGSTDGTHKILMEYDKIHTVSKVNGGTASALNAGIRNSKGKWIRWISADDVMVDNSLSVMLGMVNNIPDRENCIFYTNYDRINALGDHVSQFLEHNRPESELWNYFYGNGSSSLIHKNVFKKCGVFDESLKHSEDYEFWLRATQVYGVRLHWLDMKSIKYRVHPDQLTNKVGGQLNDFIKNKIRGMVNGKTVTG